MSAPSKYVPPDPELPAFTCSSCGVFTLTASEQIVLHDQYLTPIEESADDSKKWMYVMCIYCKNFTIWRGKKLIWPSNSTAPPPHQDMPGCALDEYNEARAVLDASPRAASALLRLAIEKLCKEIGDPSKSLNDNIAKFVQEGLPVRVQQALDFVRVTGNEQIHGGQMDLRDNVKVANILFESVNIIVEEMIARKKRHDDAYSSLPESAIAAIDERDRKSTES